jgi:hypothetical protein
MKVPAILVMSFVEVGINLLWDLGDLECTKRQPAVPYLGSANLTYSIRKIAELLKLLLLTLIIPFIEAFVGHCGVNCNGCRFEMLWLVGRLVFFILLSNIVLVSLFAIYFLSDRIQTEGED